MVGFLLRSLKGNVALSAHHDRIHSTPSSAGACAHAWGGRLNLRGWRKLDRLHPRSNSVISSHLPRNWRILFRHTTREGSVDHRVRTRPEYHPINSRDRVMARTTPYDSLRLELSWN